MSAFSLIAGSDPYDSLFMTKHEMRAFATDKGLSERMKWSRSVQFLREDLAIQLSRLEYGDDEEEVEVEEGENGYLVEFLRSAFLQPTKKGREEGQSQYMAHGHRAEEPFLKEFYEITQQCDAVQASNLVAIYAPGMTMNRKRMC